MGGKEAIWRRWYSERMIAKNMIADGCSRAQDGQESPMTGEGRCGGALMSSGWETYSESMAATGSQK